MAGECPGVEPCDGAGRVVGRRGGGGCDHLQQLCLPLTPSAIPSEMLAAVEEQGLDVPLVQDHQPTPGRLDEAEQIRHALAQTRGNVVQAARVLGVSRDTLRYRMRRYRIDRIRPTVADRDA